MPFFLSADRLRTVSAIIETSIIYMQQTTTDFYVGLEESEGSMENLKEWASENPKKTAVIVAVLLIVNPPLQSGYVCFGA
jgi:hypothetical protein